MTSESQPTAVLEELERPSKRQKGMTRFQYRRPEEDTAKVHVPIANSDIMYCAVQVVPKGGKTNLHSHSGMDGLWYVLSGRLRFYNDQGLVGEFGQNEGIFVPRGTPYWFENAGEEPAEVLQAEAMDRNMLNQRIDHEPRTRSFAPVKVIRGTSRPV